MIPAYNEADNIKNVIQHIPRNFPGVDDVVVAVIDDGSTDGTWNVAKQAGAEVVVKHPRNLGVARAFMTGMKVAQRLDSDAAVNIDADGQFDPHEIPLILTPLMRGDAHVVIGSRFLNEANKGIPLIKRLGNNIISSIVSVLCGQHIHDTQCGFRAMSNHAMKNMKLSGLFTYTQEMILHAAFNRMALKEVPISVQYFNNRKSRIVSNIPRYTLQVLGIIAFSVIRNFWKTYGVMLLFALAALVFGVFLQF